MKSKLIEICAYSVQSAINAQIGGADRVELCSNPLEGGITPSYAAIQLARRNIDIALNVLIRPRGGDFCYSSIEYETMKQEIDNVKILGADGIVIGILRPAGTIDVERTKELIEMAKPMTVTFHRAFDLTSNPYNSLEQLIKIGVERVLTSGQKQNAFHGKEIIKKLVELSKDEIIVMAGGGINSGNIVELIEYTRAKEFHLSAIKKYPGTMQFKNESVSLVSRDYLSDYDLMESDESIIRQVVTKIRSFR